MRRKIYDKLLKWKQERNGDTALLIEGARRIGKSYTAEEFARNEYESYILIDFSKAPARVKSWFDDYLEDVDTLLQNIQLHYKKHSRRASRSSSSTKCRNALAPAKPSRLWWPTIVSTTWKPARSFPSRKTSRTSLFLPKKKASTCIRWTSRNSFGRWETKC